MIDASLLEILACPRCKGDLVLDEEKSRLLCAGCQLGYPIEEGIPVLLVEQAKPLRPGPAQERA